MPSICLESGIVNGKTRFIFQMNVYTLWGYVCYLPRTEMAYWFTSRNLYTVSTRTTQYISLALFTQTDLDHPMDWLTLTMLDSFYVLHSHSSPILAHLSRRLTGELLVYQCLQCLSDICQHFSKLGQFNSNFIWRLHKVGEQKFVQMFLVTCPRWPPYKVEKILKTLKANDLGYWG